MTAIKRILAVMIACALLSALSLPAWAEGRAVCTARDDAVVYDKSGDPVGALPANTQLTLLGVKGNVCQISYKGKTGYMNKSDLLKQTAAAAEGESRAEATEVNVTAYAAKNGAKVFNAKGKVVAKLSLNTEVTVTAVKGDVCRIRLNGKTGYMNKSDLSKKRAAVAEATVEPAATATAEPKAMSKTAYVATDGAPVYDKKGKAVSKLDQNTEVTVTAVKGDICRVSINGKTGYMKKSDLSASRVETAKTVNQTAYVSKDGAKVYNSKGKVVASLSLNTAVNVTAVSGKLCKIYVGGNTGYMSADDLSSKKVSQLSESAAAEAAAKSSATPARGSAREMDWWDSDIQNIFSKGTTAIITDVETGLAWREQRRGGTNHADVQPLTAADTAAMKQACGGEWSWNRRAIFVTIDGVNYAASMNGMPHGSGSITDNDFNGHHCIHFTNSRTHGGNKVCPLHQAAIQKALEATL